MPLMKKPFTPLDTDSFAVRVLDSEVVIMVKPFEVFACVVLEENVLFEDAATDIPFVPFVSARFADIWLLSAPVEIVIPMVLLPDAIFPEKVLYPEACRVYPFAPFAEEVLVDTVL